MRKSILLVLVAVAACSSGTGSTSGASSTSSNSTGSSSGTSTSTTSSSTSGNSTGNSSGTSGSVSGSASSTGASSGGSGYSLVNRGLGAVDVSVLFTYDQSTYPGQGTEYDSPGADGGSPSVLAPNSYSLSETSNGVAGSGSLTIAESGSTLTFTFHATSSSTLAGASSSVGVAVNNFAICFASPGATQVDFAYNCAGNIASNPGSSSAQASITDGSTTICENSALQIDGVAIPVSGWSPATFTRTGIHVIDGVACDDLYDIGVQLGAGEVDGQELTGDSSADVTFTVTATPHS